MKNVLIPNRHSRSEQRRFGASFVITQFHTSVMFAPNIVGTANATAAGWGNLGGGVTQFAMPLLFTAFMSYGAGSWWSWRLAMLTAGIALVADWRRLLLPHRRTLSDGDWKTLRREEPAGGPAASKPSAFFAGVPRSARMVARASLRRVVRHRVDGG